MKKCRCSERPLVIISSKTVMVMGVPYEQLDFACSNKNCSEYHKPVARQMVNLMDRGKVVEEEIG